MTHDEHRYWRRQLGFYKGDYVGDDEGCWAGEAAVCGFLDGATPAPLIEGVDFDAAGCQRWEELIVSIYMVVEAVDEDQFGYRGAIGLVGGQWLACLGYGEVR